MEKSLEINAKVKTYNDEVGLYNYFIANDNHKQFYSNSIVLLDNHKISIALVLLVKVTLGNT